MIARGEVDVLGTWEPTVKYGIQALGGKDSVVVFQDRSVYRDIFNLHSTVEKLTDKEVRKKIVAFVTVLRRARVVFEREPERVYERVGKAVEMELDVVRAVWSGHIWTGRGVCRGNLLDMLVEEEKWVRRVEKRKTVGREKLASFIDGSVLREAEEAEGVNLTNRIT